METSEYHQVRCELAEVQVVIEKVEQRLEQLLQERNTASAEEKEALLVEIRILSNRDDTLRRERLILQERLGFIFFTID